MDNNEFLEYIETSIRECDRLKHEYLNKNGKHFEEMSKVFEGMSEAYCDVYEKLTGEPYDLPIIEIEMRNS